jgi:hypothetical protein
MGPDSILTSISPDAMKYIQSPGRPSSYHDGFLGHVQPSQYTRKFDDRSGIEIPEERHAHHHIPGTDEIATAMFCGEIGCEVPVHSPNTPSPQFITPPAIKRPRSVFGTASP